MSYSYVVRADAFDLLLSLPEEDRSCLGDLFRRLAAHPHEEAVMYDYDDSGRKISLSLCGGYVVSHWTDHSLREVRITDIQSA